MREVIEGFRSSPQQQRLLALRRVRGGQGQLAWLALHLRGSLNPAALRTALDTVVEDNEILRTRVVREPRSGVELQVIGVDVPAWEPAADWSGIPAAEVERRVNVWAAETLACEGDPSCPPLVSAALVRLGADEHLLRVRVPAALADAATMAMLMKRLAGAYAGEVSLQGRGLQFADVAEWQNESLESDEGAAGRRHWEQCMSAARAMFHLPWEESRAGVGPASPGLAALETEMDLLPRLEAAAASAGVPLSTLVLAGWMALLHRLTGQTVVRLAAAFDGRGFEELRDALGPFTRYLPVECGVTEETPLPELARTLDRALVEAARRQDSFMADISAVDGEPVTPLGFAWHPLPAPCRAGGTEWAVREAMACPEPFRAALLCAPGGGQPGARLLYDPAHLADEAAARLAGQAATVLQHLAREPASTVGALEVLGEREREWVLGVLSTGHALSVDEGDTVDAWIMARMEATPDRVAVRWEDGAITYGELRDRVNSLAAHLRAQGVGRETRVGILLGRIGDAVAAMLAVMRVGAAYVPLDPAYPRERLVLMLRDSGATVLVTDPVRAELADGTECRVVQVDGDRGESGALEDGGPRRALPESAAYVIYTSGTSGQPKGIVIEHRALARYVRAASAALDLPEQVEYAVVSTLAADLGATMIFPALCRGGTLHLVSEQRATDPEAWTEYAERHGIDCLKVVPSHLHLLLEASRPQAALPRLRLVLGGEACDRELVDRARRLAPGCRIFNHYGPTETTVGVVAGELAGATGDDDGAQPPLGRPLPGVRIYLLDARGRPVPVGVPGEVHVGGGTLSRGYLGQPGLTAECFLPDPFSGEPGARMYRAGDRARWRSDGRLDFLGRMDDQVKVNGYRVEPGEVESVLLSHPGVAASRVVPRQVEGARCLVAYVVPTEGAVADVAELRHHLRERLPEPFVPAAFVLLRCLPLTPNGKVDLRALPDPAGTATGLRGERIEPRNEAEATLVAVWEEVLGRRGVGVTDDFFELGGNSFMAVRLMSRIQKQFGRRLSLAALIAAGTVEGMTRLLGGAGEDGIHGHLVEIRPGGPLPPLFCVHPGEGTVLCYRGLARYLDPERPVFGLQALDFEVGRPPLVRIEEMAARYVDAVTERQPAGPYLLAGWSFGGLVAFEMSRQLVARGDEVARLVLFDCRLPVTASALGRLDPVLFRISMLFPGSLLVRGGQPVVTGKELSGLDVHGQLELIARRRGVPVASLIPAHVPAEQVESYLELRMARTRGILEYQQRPAAVPITLFRTDELDLDNPFPEMREAFERAARTPDYGWESLTPEPVEVVGVPGTHHTMFSNPNVRELARAVDRHLSSVSAEPATMAGG